ncbi:MAG: MATE family efflux transporter [Cellulosilyticaceae bacterium]
MKDLTKGHPAKLIMTFAWPLMIGNLVQQLYNIVDAIVVGKFIGSDALAAVSSSFTVMVFLTSMIIGLTMGAGVVFAQYFGAKEVDKLRRAIVVAFVFVFGVTVVLELGVLLGIDGILTLTHIPAVIYGETRVYLQIIFYGLIFVFLYNALASLLRAVGDSKTPLYFLMVSALLNIVLDLVFVMVLDMGVAGVAWATLIAQAIAAVSCLIYSFKKLEILHIPLKELCWDQEIFVLTARYAVLTSIQQSIMNFGILMVQGLVNSFGTVAMAAFGAATKIDAFAYMPVQDFGNAFATYVAQNEGAGEKERVREGVRCVTKMICIFCAVISLGVLIGAEPLVGIFVNQEEVEVIQVGVGYLRVVAPFYILIGFLFMYYGYYRAIGKAQMSIVLTVISLGIRVVLAYSLAAIPTIGIEGIWWAIPIGWALADVVGYWCYCQGYKNPHKGWRNRTNIN